MYCRADDDDRERRDDGPPLPVLPVGPEVPVACEELLGDVRRGPDHKGSGDPEHQVPLAVDVPVLLEHELTELESLGIDCHGDLASHSAEVRMRGARRTGAADPSTDATRRG